MSEPRVTQILENSYDKQNGGIDVNIQSQTSPVFQYLLMNEIKTDITLTSQIEVDDVVVNVSAGHGFTAVDGEFMVCRNGDTFFQLRVKSVATNAITIEAPIDSVFPVIGTSVIRGNINMNIDGSTTPVDFKFGLNDPSTSIPIDISAVIVTMQHTAEGGDGLFGAIAPLSLGLFLRKVNGENRSLGNYTTNQEFRDVGADIAYTDKGAGANFATNITIDLEKVFKQVIRIDPVDDDVIYARVRDDLTLTAKLTKLTISILGSFTRGE